MPKILEENRLMMRVHCGEAKTEKETLKLSTSVHGAPVVEFEDSTIVYWTWEELIEEAVKRKNS